MFSKVYSKIKSFKLVYVFTILGVNSSNSSNSLNKKCSLIFSNAVGLFKCSNKSFIIKKKLFCLNSLFEFSLLVHEL